MKDCRKIDTLLSAYAAGELTDKEQGEFERHLLRCPLCAAGVEGYLETIRLARLLPLEPLPLSLAERLEEILERVKRERTHWWELPSDI